MGAITNSMLTLQHAAGGILGMVIGMLVETLLFIIRTHLILIVRRGRPRKLDMDLGIKRTSRMSSIWYSDGDGIRPRR